MHEIVISGAARTAMGGLQGTFCNLSASDMGGPAIRAAMKGAGVKSVDEVIMGCVLPAGQGQAPARQAVFSAGLSHHVPATTVNKMCGSGMKAVMMASDQIALGYTETAVAGGMESMTNSPYLLPKMRSGARIGHQKVVDHMFLDGLEDAYDQGRLMGSFAEECAEAYQFTRQAQDEYALSSLTRAREAQEKGLFKIEIAAVDVPSRSGTTSVVDDEQLALARPEKIPHLKSAFRENGTVTAANSSSISDGAAALVLARASVARSRYLPIRAKIVGYCSHAQAPSTFTTAPVPAVQKLLDRIGWSKESIDLWEVNEAFAVVPLAFMQEMSLDIESVNIHGGACALGHPIGASGARIIVTLLNALEQHALRRGVAAICIGGGEATAIAIERDVS
ncbi:MAG: acetyl-CoA C-acyltransferase [Aestuariivita sp.]|nr:acetyl-CoA C-acyltransferase [Aestuariivita sp.]